MGYRKALGAAVVFLVIVFLGWLAFRSAQQQKENDVDLSQLTMPVVGLKAQRQSIAESMDLTGTLRAKDILEIKSQFDGPIKSIDFVSGQKVHQGQVLILFDQSKLKAALLGAEANLYLAKSNLKRCKLLLAGGGISRFDFDQAQTQLQVARSAADAATVEFSTSIITAPFDGVMGERAISAGQLVSRGDSLGVLVNQKSMKADFHLPEKYLNQVTVGQPVEIKVEAYPQKSFEGKIVFIAPTVDEATRTILITADVPNPQEQLRQGMFAEVNLTVTQAQALVVPENAVVLNGADTVVYVVKPDMTVEVKTITTGLHTNGVVEVINGLNEGDVVVTEGSQKIHSGSKVDLRLQGT